LHVICHLMLQNRNELSWCLDKIFTSRFLES
jgi:hypothetical protein